MFHLLSHTAGSGGASLLVDGFRAANILKKQSPEAYHVLRSIPVPTHSSGNQGISVQPSTPLPVLNEHPVTGELYQVRWNNDDRATMDDWENEADIDVWYNAARMWAKILRDEGSEYWEQLKPGRPLSLIYQATKKVHLLTRLQFLTTGGSFMGGRLSRGSGECVVVTVSTAMLSMTDEPMLMPMLMGL